MNAQYVSLSTSIVSATLRPGFLFYGGSAGSRTVIRYSNTNITHNLNAATWTPVPLFGALEASTDDAAGEYTALSETSLRVNYTGIALITVHLHSSAGLTGGQFTLRITKNSVAQAPVEGSAVYMGGTQTARLPAVTVSVASGDTLSAETMANLLSGTTTIGAAGTCYMTVEKL